MKQHTFFSVLVPTYNQEKYLPQALDSLLAQTYSNWEAVVVDDGSTDDTAKIMKRYAAKDKRFRLLHQENGGCPSALNAGVRNAAGDWICWLSSDDLFEPDKLAIHADEIEKTPGIKFFYSHFYHLDEETGRKSAPEYSTTDLKIRTISLMAGYWIHGNSICINRHVFDDVGLFNEELKYAQDCDMWLRICAKYPSVFIHERTCVTRWHKAQTTNSFPEGGVFDTAVSCVDFLNNHAFPELFPTLDLSEPESAGLAVSQAINISTSPGLAIFSCGYTPALLERTMEWLSRDCPLEIKESLVPRLSEVVRQVLDSQLPVEIKSAFMQFQAGLYNQYTYVPHRFLDEVEEFANNLPKDHPHRIALTKYLSQSGARSAKISELNYQGEILLASGDLEGALDSFTKAVAMAPSCAPAHKNLAAFHLRNGAYEKALYHFERVLENNGSDRTSVLKCAELLENFKKIKKVKTLYTNYLKLDPADQEILLLLKQSEEKLSVNKKARKAKKRRR